MKTRVMKFAKVLMAVVLAFGILFSALPADRAEAAAKMTNKKAQKILKKKIKNKFCKYMFADIDNDKIDEMFVLGFSGKFVDGDDKKKTLTVYKVVNKKAKAIYTYTRKGDFFHPTLAFKLAVDSDKNFYMTVADEHEGYNQYIMYMYGASETFNEIARIDDDVASNETEYRIRGKVYSEKEFQDFGATLGLEEIDINLKSCSTKVANKYLKKMLMAEYDYRCGLEIYDKETASPVYSDEDGDGIDELIVRTGALGGELLYVRIPDETSTDYYVSAEEYIIENGRIVFVNIDYNNEITERSEEEIDALEGIWVAEDGDSYMEVKNGTMTYYIGKKGKAEAADSFIIVLAGGDEPHGFYAMPKEEGRLQTFFTYSPEEENGEADRLIFDMGGYSFVRA